MTIIEDKLKQLEDSLYLGRYPEDFQDFWLEGLRTDQMVPARLELKEIAYPLSKVEVFAATILSGDRVELKGYYLRPTLVNINDNSSGGEKVLEADLPGLVRFHGYSGNRGQISELLFWALQGYAILALDVRGQCGETPDRRVYPSGAFSGWLTLGLESPHRHYLRQVYLDAVRAVEALASRPEVDKERIGCIGKSQGGGLAVMTAGLINTLGKEVGLESQVKAVTAAMPFLTDFRRTYQLQSGGPLDELSWYFRLFDPEHKREEEVFRTLDYFDVVNFASWVGQKKTKKAKEAGEAEKRVENEEKRPATLISMGLRDTVCPPPTVYSLYRAIGGEKKLLVYPEYGHESPDEFVDRQIEFLARELGLDKNSILY